MNSARAIEKAEKRVGFGLEELGKKVKANHIKEETRKRVRAFANIFIACFALFSCFFLFTM